MIVVGSLKTRENKFKVFRDWDPGWEGAEEIESIEVLGRPKGVCFEARR